MPTSAWTDLRLTRLFDRYRCRYWPRSRRLARYRLQIASLPGTVQGRIEITDRVLLIDVAHHTSDREVRATVLHEMIHAVLGRGGHRAPFWTELESLLARRAPITVNFGELGECGGHLHIIPRRFRRCRRLFRPVHERAQRELARLPVLGEYTLTPQDVAQECEDMAIQGSMWAAVWGHAARTYGFVDLDGRVLPWARRYHAAARRGYICGRRFCRGEEQRRAAWEAAQRAVQGS